MENEENNETKPELDISRTPPDLEIPKPRRKRSYKIEKDEIAKFVLDGLQRDLDDRAGLIVKRMDRRAKLQGWLPQKDWPFPNCANFWVPIMLIADLKTRGTLENAIKSVRPMLQSMARQGRNAGKEENIDKLLDFQFFVENGGEKAIDDLVTNFVQDEAVFGYVQWVKETQTFHDTRILPGIPPEQDVTTALLENLKIIFPTMQTQVMTDNDGWDWEVTYTDENTQDLRSAGVNYYELDDGKLQACIVTQATTHDGPVVQILDFEDVVFPVRCANLQPITESNPGGAPYVNTLFSVSLDTIRRRMDDGTYDQLTEEDWDDIKAGRSGAGSDLDTERPKEQKDQQEGTQVSLASLREDRLGVKHFGRFDVDGDGLDEDCIVWVLRETKKILKVSLLTEHYPGLPIRRPLVHDSFIPTPGRVYGRSQDELLESLQDCTQTLMDQHIDWGTLTNTPFFFYRAASGLKAEPIYLEPGQGIPLDNPTGDVNFPQFAQKDSGFALNTIAVLQQFVERLQMFSDVSFGRVPTGKASALRTLGTTMSLLAQGDARAEQVLRRIFGFLSGMYMLMHRQNVRFLPNEKEIRVIGMAEEGQDAYMTVKPEEINGEVDFSFKATLINTNKEVVGAALKEFAAIAISPLAIQAGIVTQEEIYNMLRDIAKSADLTDREYVKKPLSLMQGPKLLWTDVVGILVAHEIPKGQPMEPPEIHLMKLQEFMQTPEFGFLTTPEQIQNLRMWMEKIQMYIMQQQMMMAAMGGGGGQPGQPGQEQGGGGPGGAPTTFGQGTGTADNAPVGQNEMIDESANPGGLPQ